MTFDRDKLRKQLEHSEKFVSHAYTDSLGFQTIGIGRLIDKRRGGGISYDEALYLLDNDINEKVADLDRTLPWWRDLDDVRQRILIDMTFNMGIGGLLTFQNTLAAIKAGDYAKAASNMQRSLWAKQVKSRAVRLCKAMETGDLE